MLFNFFLCYTPTEDTLNPKYNYLKEFYKRERFVRKNFLYDAANHRFNKDIINEPDVNYIAINKNLDLALLNYTVSKKKYQIQYIKKDGVWFSD